MKRRTAVPLVIALVCAGTLALIGMRHTAIQQRTAAAAIKSTVDAHAVRITSLLSVPADENADIEDAIFRELTTRPSTSLITRSDIRVEQVPNASARRCVIQSRAAGMQRIVLASPTADANP